MKIKRLAVMAMLCAMAIILSILESMIPVFIPGVKLGLANVIILIMLYEFKPSEAFIVNICRIILVGLLRSTLLTPTFLMSLSGGIVSFVFMFLLSRFKVFSPIGVSVVGSISHSFGQIIMAIILVSTEAVIYYLPFIALLSLATGVVSGIITSTYLKRSITSKFIGE